MKGYIINNRCYIFPQEVGQLPSIDAEIIYVQEEDIKAWKEANVGVADKIKKYNYNVITVNPIAPFHAVSNHHTLLSFS